MYTAVPCMVPRGRSTSDNTFRYFKNYRIVMHTCTCSMMYLGVHTAVRVPLHVGTGGDTAHVS